MTDHVLPLWSSSVIDISNLNKVNSFNFTNSASLIILVMLYSLTTDVSHRICSYTIKIKVLRLRTFVTELSSPHNERRMHPLPSGWETYVSCSLAQNVSYPLEIRGNSLSWLRKSGRSKLFLRAKSREAYFWILLLYATYFQELVARPMNIIPLCKGDYVYPSILYFHLFSLVQNVHHLIS